jgi:hypothetical protein
MCTAILKKMKFFAPAVFLIASMCYAQENGTKAPTPDISYFHLEFIVKTIDSGKVISSRTYNMDANTDRNFTASYRSGSSNGGVISVTYYDGAYGVTDNQPSTPEQKVRSLDQTNIDCSKFHLVGSDSVSMQLSALISTASNPDLHLTSVATSYSGIFTPLVPIGKPTIVFSGDGPAPNRKIQMEVTATRINIPTPPKP